MRTVLQYPNLSYQSTIGKDVGEQAVTSSVNYIENDIGVDAVVSVQEKSAVGKWKQEFSGTKEPII